MFAQRRVVLAAAALLLAQGSSPAQSTDAYTGGSAQVDRPRVAILQYESGRVLVAREINGDLIVVEPSEITAKTLSRYLDLGVSGSGAVTVQHGGAVVEQPVAPSEIGPLFYSPAWDYGPVVINTDPPYGPGPVGRATERAKQEAAEARQELQARRDRQGTTGVMNRAGRVYPSTAADREEVARLQGVQRGSGDSPEVTFYSLGGGLEYYRQRELAARAEMALLTYDTLLEEGLLYFHNRRYSQAARSFIAAAQKDHGDAGSRLHAAQCLMASGLYDQALAHVRRAFELSPLLLYRPLNHRQNYAFPEDFDRHVQTLKQHVERHPDDDAAVVLLAYELFFSDHPAESRGAMKRVKRLAARDGLANKLYQAARPVLGDLN